jgi:hypothetical protein
LEARPKTPTAMTDQSGDGVIPFIEHFESTVNHATIGQAETSMNGLPIAVCREFGNCIRNAE